MFRLFGLICILLIASCTFTAILWAAEPERSSRTAKIGLVTCFAAAIPSFLQLLTLIWDAFVGTRFVLSDKIFYGAVPYAVAFFVPFALVALYTADQLARRGKALLMSLAAVSVGGAVISVGTKIFAPLFI